MTKNTNRQDITICTMLFKMPNQGNLAALKGQNRKFEEFYLRQRHPAQAPRVGGAAADHGRKRQCARHPRHLSFFGGWCRDIADPRGGR